MLTRMLSLQVSGARIKISDRDDFMSGTSDRYESFAHATIAHTEYSQGSLFHYDGLYGVRCHEGEQVEDVESTNKWFPSS